MELYSEDFLQTRRLCKPMVDYRPNDSDEDVCSLTVTRNVCEGTVPSTSLFIFRYL